MAGRPSTRRRWPGPGSKDQVNLTDADSRIMPVAGGGFEQAYNAQALVAADEPAGGHSTTSCGPGPPTTSDKSNRRWNFARPPSRGATPETLLADSGYFSEANVNACAEAELAPLITPGAGTPSSLLEGPLRRPPPLPPENPTPCWKR